MNAHQPLFGMLTYRPRHARRRLRWPVLALPITPAAVAIADTPAGMLVISIAAALIAMVATIRWQWTRAAAKVEEIVATELTTNANPPCPGEPLS